MNILFWGTPAYAVASLNALVAAGHQVVGVVSQPDRRRGRGKQLQASPVKARALELGAQPPPSTRRAAGPTSSSTIPSWSRNAATTGG